MKTIAGSALVLGAFVCLSASAAAQTLVVLRSGGAEGADPRAPGGSPPPGTCRDGSTADLGVGNLGRDAIRPPR